MHRNPDFTKNSNQWSDPVISSDDVSKYREAENKSKVESVVSHDSYLINLCGATDFLLGKSRTAFIREIERCSVLGIKYVIFHPGAHTVMERKEAVRLVADSVNSAHDSTKGTDVATLIETTAGQGTNVGSSFDEIAEMLSMVRDKKRAGVCIDTCHIFAAGYDIRTKETYEATMKEFEQTVGFKWLHAVHLNDAKKTLGSRVDRHEHIGKGQIGKTGFRLIMNDDRFAAVPKILETPKGEDGYKMDAVNLKLLRSFVGKS